jgi:hypothetical protein
MTSPGPRPIPSDFRAWIVQKVVFRSTTGNFAANLIDKYGNTLKSVWNRKKRAASHKRRETMQNAWNKRAGRVGDAVMAVALTGSLAPVAEAQIIRANTPLNVSAEGNTDRLRILPVVTSVYDSNLYRSEDLGATGPRDNIRVSPGASIGLNRIFGRTRVGLDGTLGYDFNTRFKQLNAERINLSANVTTPVGSPCTVSGSAAFDRSQFDFANTDVATTASNQRQTYDLSGTCNRSSGFFPTIGINFVADSNSQRAALESDQVTIRGAVGYSKPSLGRVQLVVAVSKISRPNIKSLLGINDDTTISFAEVVFSRAVSPRVSFDVGLGITHAQPARSDVAPFTGPSFDASVSIRPIPRFIIAFTAARSVQNQSGYSATYIIADNYGVSASYQLSARTTATVFAQQSHRDPRGQDLLQLVKPRGNDTQRQVGVGYSFDFRKSLRFNLSLARRSSTVENQVYNYSATSASAGVSARF